MMGGDHGLRVSLPAALKSLADFPDLELVLVACADALAELDALSCDLRQRVSLVTATDVVAMDEKPSVALRHKKHSSMRLALDLLAAGRVDAVVSAGNTGALMAMGCHVLKTMPGIDRPAICTAVPSAAAHCYMLDLGANSEASAQQLYEFALMGSALAASLDGIARPRVALLNIGEELTKGCDVVKAAAQLLASDPQLNFTGYVEGDDILAHRADVIVCDGFVGNVALKTCEGTAAHIAALIKKAAGKTVSSRLRAWLAAPLMRAVYRQLDPQQYNGASLLGLNGVVIKAHGGSNVEGFGAAIARARAAVNGAMLGTLQRQLAAQRSAPLASPPL